MRLCRLAAFVEIRLKLRRIREVQACPLYQKLGNVGKRLVSRNTPEVCRIEEGRRPLRKERRPETFCWIVFSWWHLQNLLIPSYHKVFRLLSDSFPKVFLFIASFATMRCKAIAYTVFRQNIDGMGGIWLDPLAQVIHRTSNIPGISSSPGPITYHIHC